MKVDLEGKVAVVTGGGGILCSVMAKALAKAGAKVAILDLKLDAAQKVADAVGVTVSESAMSPAVPVYIPSDPGGAPADQRTKSRLPYLIAASLLAAALLGGVIWAILHFRPEDELRVDDLYGIPSAVAEK